jgi:formylglycine-generating enzyme required for sulfatase activity
MPAAGDATRCPVCGAELVRPPGGAPAECSQCAYVAPAVAPAAPAGDAPFSKEFQDEFEVLGKIGQGAFGEVFRVRQRSLKREVVVKFTTRPDALVLARFQREGELLARLRHPAIVQVFGAGVERDRPYLVFEYLGGGTLKARIKAGGPLPPEEAVPLACTLLDALGHAHSEGMLHRDVKADNVILTEGGGCKLADFGMVRDDKMMSELTTTGAIIGTPMYIAPELVVGEKASPATDLYSAAVVVYEMLTGVYPSHGVTLAELLTEIVKVDPERVDTLMPAVPKAIADVVQKALEKQPNDRFPDAAAFASALREALPKRRPSRRITAPVASRPPLEIDASVRRRAIGIAAAAGVACAVLIAVVAWSSRGAPPPSPPESPAATSSPESVPAAIVTRDGAGMVLVPAGPFAMGSDTGRPDEAPPRTVTLDAFYIDRTEVTNGMFRKYLAATGRTHVAATPHAPGMDRDEYPMMDLTWREAADYALWAGKRLPTEAEWEKAARGTDGREWPWGSAKPEGTRRANCRDRSRDKDRLAIAQAFGEKIVEDVGGVSDGFPYTAPVGSFPAGASPYGALDMIGNVSEFCSDWYSADYYKVAPTANPPGPPTGTVRAMRGGSFATHVNNVRAPRRDDAIESDLRVGFRCALSVVDLAAAGARVAGP